MIWQPIIANPPPAEMALARCQMLSGVVDQGYVAVGTPEFVMGAGIGNAIANDMRRNDFIIQCMTMSGWRGVPKGAAAKSAPVKMLPPPRTDKGKLGGAFPPPPKPAT